MRTVSYRLGDLARATINIGKVAENEYTRVQFNAEQIFAEYPAATAALSVINPAGTAYPAVVTREGDLIIWDVTDADLTAVGMGELQLTLTENGVVIKSYIARTRIERSIVASGSTPDPVQNWLDNAAEVLEEVQDAIPAGGTQGQVMGKLSDDDYDIGWIDQTGGGGGGGTSNYNDLSNKPQIAGTTLTGNKSLEQLGIASADAVSAKYTKPASGIPASDLASGVIPDVSGFYTKPQSGIPASDIADGVIPDVSGLYTKPSGGIPKTDLASGVQTSLGKADTAYQKPAGGIPAADIASGVIPDPTDMIDDTAGDGDTDKVWSADKTAGEVSTLSSAIGMNGTEVVAGTGNPVTVRQIGATASVTSEAAKYMMCGKNLFSAGNQTVSVFKSVALPCKFPAGKYSITCVATSTDTDSDVCIINLFNGSTAAATGKSIHRGYRDGASFTATTEFDNIYFYASNSFAHSAGDTATFVDIQLEVGIDKTDFDEYRGVIKNVSESILLEHEAENFWSVTGESLSVSYMQVDPGSIEGRIEALVKKSQHPYTNFYGKTIVNFGDSIFANGVTADNDISTFIKQKTGATVINCAFGGCRMGNHSSSDFDAFGMHSLADAIYSESWTAQDTALSGQDIPAYFATNLAKLKAVDFGKVDLVTISYGTNDFTGGLRNGGSDNNSTDYALKYSIQKLLSKYPNLHIIVILPMYRVWLNGTTFDVDSNTKEVTSSITGGGTNKLTDFVKAEKDVCEETQTPYIDTYYGLGINQYNWSYYFPSTDGTHHNTIGRKLIAEYIAAKIW